MTRKINFRVIFDLLNFGRFYIFKAISLLMNPLDPKVQALLVLRFHK